MLNFITYFYCLIFQIGKTWSNLSANLNIDIDNLSLGPNSRNSKQSGAPSMNQLASNPASPLHPNTAGFTNIGRPSPNLGNAPGT